MYMYYITSSLAYEVGCVPCVAVADHAVLCHPSHPSWGGEGEGSHLSAPPAEVEGQRSWVLPLLGEVQRSGRPSMTRERRSEHDCPSQATTECMCARR
jgi:hypothetical protein